jgi:DNA modification methylase
MKTNTIHHADNLTTLRTFPDSSIDAVVTDPPYGLGKAPDALTMLNDWLTTGHHDVQGKGFMGKTWDAFVPQPVFWQEVFRVLKPGAHVLCFAGTRTYDLMTLALRIAGFEIRDSIRFIGETHYPAWVYGSGFPKSMDVAKAIEKKYGQQQWQGWGTALKPAWEPIIVARKPLEGTVADNVLRYGTGAINIDECRVRVEDQTYIARFPANLIHDGSEEVLEEFARFGSDKGGFAPVTKADSTSKTRNCYGTFATSGDDGASFYGDSGTAARFFYSAKASKSDREEGLEDFPEQQSSGLPLRSENGERGGTGNDGSSTDRTTTTRNTHPTVKPTKLMRYLLKLVVPPGGIVLDPFAGSCSTVKAAVLEGMNFIAIEQEIEYVRIGEARLRLARQTAKLPSHVRNSLESA